VREVGLREADDVAIWQYAKLNGYVMVSKDTDFQQRSLLHGAPPKFIWLRVATVLLRELKVC
jgi:predicted nuclease of predicted toxin-antitoxin system